MLITHETWKNYKLPQNKNTKNTCRSTNKTTTPFLKEKKIDEMLTSYEEM